MAELLEPRRLLSAAMVRDVNAEPINSDALGNFTDAGTQLFFTADDLVHGTELWRSDGTTDGTFLVKDINSGAVSSSPTSLYRVNNTVLFSASDGSSGAELWRSDGTEAGTFLVKDLLAGSPSSTPRDFVSLGGFTYFFASASNGTTELWKTDGTAAGTTLIVKPSSSIFGSHAYGMVATNSALHFFIGKTSAGTELWRSDGTAAGTASVKSWTGSSTAARDLKVFNDQLYFAALDSAGEELWKSDGTTAGTNPLKDVRQGSSGSAIANLTVAGTRLYFTANNGTNGFELWSTDGTAGNTAMVKDLWTGTFNGVDGTLCGMNGIVYFSGSSGSSDLRELYRSDGTSSGTFKVVDINPTGASQPLSITAINNTLYFTAGSGGGNGLGVWKSSGAVGNASLVRTFGNFSVTRPSRFIGSAGTVFFTADDNDAAGIELWKTNGVDAGTSLVRDIYPESESSAPWFAGSVGSTGYFWADDGVHGVELWKTNGTPGTTSLVADLNPSGSSDHSFERGIAFGGYFYFAANAGSAGTGVWRTDGTSVTLIASGSAPAKFFDFNGTLIFTSGSSLRRIDGSTVSTIKNFTSNVTYLVISGNQLLFAASDAANGNEIWISDGTTANTTVLKNIVSGTGSSSPVYLRAAGNGIVYFFAKGSGTDTELWKTDGTTAGTSMVADVMPTLDDHTGGLGVVNGKIIFEPWSGEPWVSDGTPQGTFLLKEINPGSTGSNPNAFVTLGDIVLFTASVGNVNGVGDALWRSDGTTAGTYMVHDVAPAYYSTLGGTNKFRVGNYVYFEGGTYETGFGLWRSDGTTQGTTLVSKIAGSTGWAMDYTPAADGSRIYISADDEIHGREVWAITPDTPAPVVSNIEFTRGAGGDRLTFTVDRDVNVDPPYNNVRVYDPVNQTSVQTRRTYDPATHQVTITFPSVPNGVLPDGMYRIGVPSGIVLTSDNTPNAQRVTLGLVLGTGANETYNILRSGENITLSKSGSFSTLSLNWLDSVRIFGNAGNDVLNLDLSGGDALPSDFLLFDGGIGADTLSLKGSANADSAAFEAGQIVVNAHTVLHAGVDSFSYESNGGSDALAVTNGNVLLPASQRFSSLIIGAGSSATLTPGGNKLIVTDSLDITDTGRLDLTDNDMIIDDPILTSAQDVEALIAKGFNGGDWLGSGITSSIARGDSNFHLAVADNALLPQPFGTAQGGPLFSGADVDDTCVLVKFTHRTDLNLDGAVTDSDAIIFGTNYESGANAYWSIGDLNMDGVFSDDDSILFGTYFDVSLPTV